MRRSARAARRLTAAALVLSLVAACSVGCGALDIVRLPADVVYPAIEPVGDAQPLPPARFSWVFEGSTLTMEVPIDNTVYEGARIAPKTMLSFREISEAEWIPEYYRAFIDEPHQEPLYEALLGNFRSLRQTLGLDDDRYAELVVSFVQTLPYRTDPVDLEPKFPIQTIGDGDGDCDDKTLLAAAILAREGYDVAILLFTPEEHVSLGIRTDGPTYGRTGYALVESTTPVLFGWVPDTLEGGIELASEPMVVRIGEGSRTYGAGRQADAVRSLLERSTENAHRAAATIEALDAGLAQQLTEIESLRSRMERLSAQGDLSGHNALVPRYNTLSEAYNRAVSERNTVVESLNAAAATVDRIAEGQTDRHGLVRDLGIE